MKSLVQYIKESEGQETIRINDLKASWSIADPKNSKGDVIIEVPEDYTDDDITSYLQDMLLESMPTDEELAKDYFGGNADDIIDVSIEFDDAIVVSENKRNLTFKYDSSLDDNYKGTDTQLKRVTLRGLRLVAMFDKLDVLNTSDDSLMQDLMDIFERTCSSKNVEYMNGKIELSIEEKDLEFDKGKNELIKE